VLFADESVFVFVFVGSKMMECAFAAVKSVTELLPLPSSTKPAKHVRVMRLEKAATIHAATFSSANIKVLDLTFSPPLIFPTKLTSCPVPRPTE
jgi:hypothetical protein